MEELAEFLIRTYGWLLITAIVVATVGLSAIWIAGVGRRAGIHREKEHNPNKTVKAQGSPVIGYKQANFFVASDGTPSFAGVINTRYQLVDDAQEPGLGFHMFSDFGAAEKHLQKGTVLLEVVGSGTIHNYDLGQITSKQRVLQIIAKRCFEEPCDRAPAFARLRTQSKSSSALKNGVSATWICAYHAAQYSRKDLKSWVEIEAAAAKAGTPVNVRALTQLKTPTRLEKIGNAFLDITHDMTIYQSVPTMPVFEKTEASSPA